MTSRPLPRPAISLVALVVVVALALLGPVLTAHAAARVAVSGQPDAASATTVRVSGSGFQSVPKAFGGVYVFFGWVSDPSGGSWAPSRGGVSGDTYRYVPDAETAQNAGYQRFVAFPGSSTEAEANGGTVAANGTWSTNLVIPGARFEAADGGTVDCTTVQCGIITIGAHGVRNANNETFTPVTFAGAGSGSGSGSGGGSGAGSAQDDAAGSGAGTSGGGSGSGSGSGDGAGSSDAGSDDDATGRPVKASLGVDQATAVVGRVLSFGAQGLEPGEQVSVTLDDGLLAVGPLVAGNHGEIAGLLELPSDLRTGTHVLRLSGASSGTNIETEVTVTRDPAEVSAAEAAAEAAGAAGAGGANVGAGANGGDSWRPEEIAVGVAALLLLVVVLSSLVTALKRRADRRRAERDAAEEAAAVSAAEQDAGEAAEGADGTDGTDGTDANRSGTDSDDSDGRSADRESADAGHASANEHARANGQAAAHESAPADSAPAAEHAPAAVVVETEPAATEPAAPRHAAPEEPAPAEQPPTEPSPAHEPAPAEQEARA
ncbi:hypothetical protein ACIGB8_05455 [Promicromonospora sukumoe]|uniref:hypothetical protein n=1 Tax=Promicromonospora sukumoe TaxID=88382 RepID=UPI0037C568E3